MLTRMFLKVYWEFKVQIECMGRLKTHSIPNAQLEDPREGKVPKWHYEHQFFQFVLILQAQCEYRLLFVEFMDSSQQEASDCR